MKNTLPIIICLLTFFLPVQAQQYQELIGKPYHLKLQAIHDFYGEVMQHTQDTALAYSHIDGLREAAKRAGDVEAVLEADLAEALYALRGGDRDLMERMYVRGQEKGIEHISCRAMYALVRHDWGRQDYERAFRGYATLDRMLQQVSIDEFPDKVIYTKDLGNAHYQFGDYQTAIQYFQQATQVDVQPFYENAWKQAQNTLGLVYQKMNNLSASDSCFRQVLLHNQEQTEIWEGIVLGNLGYNHYLRQEYSAAIPLLQKDVEIALKYGDYGLAAGSSIPLADIYTRQGEISEAKRYIDAAYEYIGRSKQTDRLRMLYPVDSKWHAVTGDLRSASRLMDSTLVAQERYHEKFSALRMLRATQERLASQEEAKLHSLQTEAQRKVNRRNLLVSGLVLCLVLVGFFGYRRRKLTEISLKERDVQLLEADRELQDARIQLDDFARTIAEKNTLLESYARAEQTTENRDLLEELSRQVVLTDEDWHRFSTLFGKVYPGFQHRLKTRYPKLTPAEVRCLSMEKLRFSNKEMAALQGISTSTVMATKHRIRKKLEVSLHAEIIELIQDI